MTLSQFAVRGEAVSGNDSEEIVRNGDSRRSLVRYRPDGSELFVHTRVNLALLKAAVPFPILLLKPESRKDEVMPIDGLLTPAGSVRNYEFLERICKDLTRASFPACYIAEQHGQCRRDFYFVTENVAGFERIASTAAAAFAFPLTFEQHSLAKLAPIILPAEAIGEIGIEVAADARTRPTRFEFWGAGPSLARLRAGLEQRGYHFLSLEPHLGELRVIKSVPIDGPGFRAVLKDIVPLARSLGCSYRGTETVEGFDQFRLTRPLPDRYAADPHPAGTAFRRIFGRRSA